MSQKRKRKKTVLQIVREYFPRISSAEAEHIIFAKTGYPGFFSGDPETCFRKQLATHARAVRLGRDTCYCCGKIRFKSQMRDELCTVGIVALEKYSQKQSLAG